MARWPAWQGASRCTGSATPGAQALMRWIMETYGDKGAQNWGIYNCRDVVGGATTSLHGEGRALDVGFPVGDRDGNRLLRRLMKAPGRLGIQCIIYERQIYSAKSPEGRYYDGAAPHYDHLHIELTWEAANDLTYRTCRRILSRRRHTAGSRTLREGKRGADVRWVQRKLGLKDVDGIYGPGTERAVKAWQRQWKERHPRIFRNLEVNGKVDKPTWRSLGVKPNY